MKELEDQYRNVGKKITFWKYYWGGTKLLQGFLVAGVAVLAVIQAKDPNFWNLFFIGFAVSLNLGVVIGNYFKWRNL